MENHQRRKQTNKNDINSGRITQIVKVLKKHNITKGINPVKARLILEDLGPVYVKLGQIMSMRPDVIPSKYCNELIKLRSSVNPLSFDKILNTISKEYDKPVYEIFETIDETPVGSASIAQVHSAYLKSGKKVVIKVQRPDIYETMESDIALLKKALGIIKAVSHEWDSIDFKIIIDEMWSAAKEEMDFTLEAEHLKEFKRLNQDILYVDSPNIINELTTKRVLVMDYIDGVPIDNIEKLKNLGYDMHEICLKLTDNYIKQIVDDGFFHADPHPGNIWINNGKIVWLDLGMVGKLDPQDKDYIKSAMIALVNKDVDAIKNIILSMGVVKGKINHAELYSDIDDLVQKYITKDIGNINIGIALENALEICNRHGISMPKGVSMLGRGLLTIEGVISYCCPQINFIDIIASHVSESVMDKLDIKDVAKDIERLAYLTSKKTMYVPSQLYDILKMAIKGQTKMNIELTGASKPLNQIDDMVNKVIICIVSAALLIGSSLVCMTDMEPKVLGIPFLGFLGYVCSTMLAIWLIIKILLKKRK